MSTMAERVLAAVDWSSYQVMGGPAIRLGVALRDLLSSSDVEESSAAWGRIEEEVFSQGTIYSAAEPTVTVMVASLTVEQPSWRIGRILDLLYFIVCGVSPEDPLMQSRCRLRAREGLWLLARLALDQDGWARVGALEVIDVIAPEQAGVIRSAVVQR